MISPYVYPLIKIKSYKPNNDEVFNKVIEVVCNYFQIKSGDIIRPTRKREICDARHLAIYITLKNSTFTLNDLSQRFGGRDHTTMIHSRDKIQGQLNSKNDNNFKTHFENIMEVVNLFVNKKIPLYD